MRRIVSYFRPTTTVVAKVGTVCCKRSQVAATTGNISVGVDRIHRENQVSVNGTNSEWINVTCGIPQSSGLGPIMFVLYINGLPNIIVWMYIMFAYDTINSPCG